jgi:exopolyphosphatase / guanosine-5'-triphosphate,3'-diphosphate pyrophosphatase
MHFAAMDLGSNSFHLLAAARGARGELVKLGSYKEVLKLASSIDEHGALPASVIARALDAVGTMLAFARFFRATPLAVGTSALRSAVNAQDFVQAAWERFALKVEILSGSEEADLVYRGARSGLSGLPGRVAVVDLGGGSVEVAVGDADYCHYTGTLPLGFLRFAGVGRSDREIRERVRGEIDGVAGHVRALEPEACVASGGTARALAKILGPAARVEGRPVHRDELRSLARELLHADTRRLADLGVDPARRDAIGLGATVLSAVVDALGAPSLRISPAGLREGVVLKALRALDAPQRSELSSFRFSAPRATDLAL